MRWVVRVIVVVLVFAGLVLGGMAYISRNDFALVRNELVNLFSEQIGKQLVIEGAINIKASLLPTVTIAGIKLENVPWATEPWLLTAERLDVRVRLIPALIGNYSISDARLRQVQLNLEIDENDVKNWVPDTLVETGDGERKADPELFVQDLTMDDVHVVLADQRTGETHALGVKRLKLHAKDADTPVAIELDGHLNHKLLRIFGQIGTWKQLNKSIFAHVDLKAEYTDARFHITGGPKSGVSYSLGHLVFGLEASGSDIREFQSFFLEELPETRSFNLLASLESEGTELHTTIEKLEIANENASMQASGVIDNLYSPENLDLQWQTEGKDIAQVATVFGLPDLPSTESFTAHSRVLLRDGSLAMREINFEAIKGAISARVTGHVDDAEEFSGIALQANLHGEDARQLGMIVGIKLPATDVFSIHTGLTDSKGLLAAKDFKVEIQQGDLEAIITGQVADLTRLSGIDATLEASGIDLADLDRLIAPLTKAQVSNLLPSKESSKDLSERFTLTAKLNGPLKKISADEIKARIERYGTYFKFSGAIGDASQFKELDIGFKSWGESLANLNEFVDRELPRTGRFRVSGQMSGRIVDPAIQEIAAHVQFEEHEFTASGYLGQLSDLQAMELEINAEGGNLQRIGDEFSVNLPDSNSYQLSTRLGMRGNAMVFEDLVLKQERRGLNAEYRGAIFNVLDQPQFELEFVARGPDSRIIGMFLGMQPRSVGAFEYGAMFKGNMQRIAINDFYAKFGETNFRGQATFIPGDKIRIENAHISGRIDLTPWRKHGKRGGENVIDDEFARKRIFSTTPIPFDDLNRFDLDLLVDELTINDVLAVVTLEEARIRMQSGVVLVDPLIVRYQNAIVTGGLELRAGSLPTVRLDVLSEGFDLGKYLAETRGLNDISANLDLQINVTGQGQSIAEIMSNLNGEFHLLVTDGLLPRTKVSLRVTDFFTNAFTFLKNKPNLVISCALTHAIIQSGSSSHQVVFLDSDQMILSGAGTIDLSEETLDFVLAPRPKKQRLFSTEFDVNVKGSVLEPELSLNKASATTTALKKYGAFSILGPAGLLLPVQRSKVGDHACVKSISELQD